MKRRVELEDDESMSVVDRIARAMAGQYLRDALARIRSQILETWNVASARAVACLAAAALLVTALVLIVRGGLLGLIAIQVPPAVAYLGIGVVALLAALFILKSGSRPQGGNLN
ncbi:MAG TPA: hypothetical protein VEN81_10030 [Planctomycetota bacterium]|nr:hypothetical protein [Planctomycetota bacterium]